MSALDDAALSTDPKVWRAAIRGKNRVGDFVVVAKFDREPTWSVGVRHFANTHWLRRAEGFSSDAAAEAWGRNELAALATEER